MVTLRNIDVQLVLLFHVVSVITDRFPVTHLRLFVVHSFRKKIIDKWPQRQQRIRRESSSRSNPKRTRERSKVYMDQSLLLLLHRSSYEVLRQRGWYLVFIDILTLMYISSCS